VAEEAPQELRTAAQAPSLAAHVTGELAEKPQGLRPSDVQPRVQRQGQSDPVAVRRHDERPDAGDLFMRAGAHRERRRRAARCPRSAKHRRHQEAGFIEADQVSAPAREFFLPGSSLAGSTRARGDRRAPSRAAGALRTEAARPQQSSDVIWMVDDLEAVADDVDDPSARPEARRVAGGFRSGHDQAR